MSFTITQDGKLLTETQEGITMPADYSFSAVNDYVHGIDRTYEELECLCLGMACYIDKIEKRISHQRSDAPFMPGGIAECAAFLRQFQLWRRGDKDMEMPAPAEIGLNIDFAIDVLDSIAGHDHVMVIAATRYCLGRMTYIVGDCADWLMRIWPLLNDKTRNIIQRDIDEAFERDDADRAAGLTYKALGHDCDRKQWEKVRALWQGEKA